MSPTPQHDGCPPADELIDYALELLPAEETTALAAHLAECAACRQELDSLRPVVDGFVAWPVDVLRPSGSLWSSLARRIAEETGQAALPPAQEWVEPEWEEVAPGISCKLLATDTERERVSMLVRLAPGTAYPPHRHAGVEELHLLDGELMIEDRKLYPGDYNLGEPGAIDHYVYSETGCTCVLVTGTKDELL